MPVHDYSCSVCGEEVYDHYLPLLTSVVPPCACGGKLERLWTTNRTRRIFQAFDFTLDDGKVVHVDSLARLRKLESDSMKSYEKGEGRPYVFRHYSQDPSNADKGIFSHLQPKQIDPKKARTLAAAMEFGTYDKEPEFHPATLRAMETGNRNRSRSR